MVLGGEYGPREYGPGGVGMVPGEGDMVLGYGSTPLCGQNDTRPWKHYLPASSLAGDKYQGVNNHIGGSSHRDGSTKHWKIQKNSENLKISVSWGFEFFFEFSKFLMFKIAFAHPAPTKSQSSRPKIGFIPIWVALWETIKNFLRPNVDRTFQYAMISTCG